MQPSPHAIRLPPWFVETLLDVREDAAEAGRDGKHLLLYLGQDGCPYCQQLRDTSFSDTRIAAQAQRARGRQPNAAPAPSLPERAARPGRAAAGRRSTSGSEAAA